MRVGFEDVFPIYGIEDNVLINKYGDMATCFLFQGKEVFSLDKNGFADLAGFFDSAFNFLDESYVVHQQFISLDTVYNSPPLEFETYMSKAYAAHFLGKRYYKTYCYVTIIRTDTVSIKRGYSTTRKPGEKGKRISFDIQEYNSTCAQYVSHLKSNGISMVPLTRDQVERVLDGYFSFFREGVLSDLEFSDSIKVGDCHGTIFALNNDENQPEQVLPYAENKEYSTESGKIQSDLLYNLTFGLKCDHVVNVIYYLDGQRFWKDALEKRSKSLESMASFSSDNKKKAEDNRAFLEDTIKGDGNKKVVRMHMNVLFWADSREALKTLKGVVKGCFIDRGMRPHEANYLDIKNIYLSSCLGNAGTMPYEETFVTHSDIAACYLLKESIYDRSAGTPSKDGLILVDRVSGIPMFRDMWDLPYRTKKIDNRNGLVVGKSGGGKSSTTVEVCRQFLEMGFNITAIDIGGSLELFVREYDGNYIIYRVGMALGINPFDLKDAILTVDHLEYLATFVFILWKPKENLEDERRQVLERLIVEFYKAEKVDNAFYKARHITRWDIKVFYKWVSENKELITVTTRGRDEFFDLDSFIIVLEQFVTGKFSNLFVVNEGERLVDPTKKITVFELDNIKDHPTLFPIFAMLIGYMSLNVLLGSSGGGKILVYDEAHKILEKPGMAINLRYQYKTYRKFDAGVWICIQQISDIDIPNTNIEESIRGNCDLKYIMRHAVDAVDSLVDKLKLSEHQKALLMSIQNNLAGKYGYFEHLNIVGTDSKVVRTMVSPQQRVIMMSDKEDKKELYSVVESVGGDWHKGIEKFIKIRGWS